MELDKTRATIRERTLMDQFDLAPTVLRGHGRAILPLTAMLALLASWFNAWLLGVGISTIVAEEVSGVDLAMSISGVGLAYVVLTAIEAPLQRAW